MAANPGSPCGLPHGVGPSGEESCDDAVALKRSKRPALVFGQIRPLKRPFGAVETQGLNGDVATLRLHQDDQTRHTGHMSPCVQAKGVRIIPDLRATGDNAPSHRVLVGRAEIGAAWSKRSGEGRDYLGLKLDDPSFNAPIYANLFDDEDGESHSLIWSRPNGRRSD